MPKLNFQIPERNIEKTHKLAQNANLYKKLPTENETISDQTVPVENFGMPTFSTINDPAQFAGRVESKFFVPPTAYMSQEVKRNPSEIDVLLVENYVGYRGVYSKIKLEESIFYTLSDNLTPLEEFSSRYKLLTPFTNYVPPRNIFQEESEILDWVSEKIDTSLYDDKTQQYFCCVETEYDSDNLQEDQIRKFCEDSLIKGLQIIFKAHSKKSDETYIRELIENYYISARVQEWTVRMRSCSNFYSLVTIPRKFLYSNEIIDYRLDRDAAARDGVSGGLLKPGADTNDIVSSVIMSMLDWNDFSSQIDELVSVISRFAELQKSYAVLEADKYMGGMDSSDFLREIGLNLYEEAAKFNDPKNGGNFVNVIKRLLEINNISNLSVKYNSSTENNIFFGLDSSNNIIYIDVIRNNVMQPLYIDGYVFDNEFGDYGIVSPRSVNFLKHIGDIKAIFSSNVPGGWNKEFDNSTTYEKFVEKFVSPPPKDVSFRKRDIECVKTIAQKLLQDGLINGLKEAQPLAELTEFNVRKIRYTRNAEALELNKQKSNLDKAKQADQQQNDSKLVEEKKEKREENDQLTEEDKQVLQFYADTNEQLKQYGMDFSNIGGTALNELKKIIKSNNFQRALIARIICWIRDMNNVQSLANIDGLINSDIKKKVEDALVQLLCTPFFETLVKGLAAFKIPDFNPLDTQKAFRMALAKGLAEVIYETYSYFIRELLKALADCGKIGTNGPQDVDVLQSLDDAINDLLNSNSPFANDGLNNMYTALDMPKAESNEQDIQANQETKNDVKNLISDIACILNPYELCRLLAEGNSTDEVYSLIKSLIIRKYPNLADKLTTHEQINSFFNIIGNAVNITELCDNLKDQQIIFDNCICDPGAVDANNRAALESNGLTPEQIDAIIEDANKKRQKRMDELLNALNNKPEELLLLCKDGKPGIVNVAEVDDTYKEQVKTALEGSLSPIYQMFNEDLKEWPSNMSENPRFQFDPGDMSTILNSKTKEDAAALKQVLIKKEIIVPDIDGAGKWREEVDPSTGKIIEGTKGYKPNPNPPSAPPIIAPILRQSLLQTNYFEIQGNTLIFRVNSDAERQKFSYLASMQIDINVQERIRLIAAEKIATIGVNIGKNLSEAIFEFVRQYSTGGIEDDIGFWFGWSKIETKYGDGWKWLYTKLPTMLYSIYELLDAFIVDSTDSKKSEALTQLPTAFARENFLDPERKNITPRAVQAREAGNLNIAEFDSKYNTATTTGVGPNVGNSVGYIEKDIVTYVKINDAEVAILKEDLAIKVQAKEAIAAEYAKTGKFSIIPTDPKDPLALLIKEAEEEEFAKSSYGKKLERDYNEAQKKADTVQSRINELEQDKAVLTGNAPLTSTVVFDGINGTLDQISVDLKNFEESFTFKAILDIIKSIRENVSGLYSEISALYAGIEDAKSQLANLEYSFPNYEIRYTFGIDSQNSSNLSITKNEKDFISSIFQETVPEDVLKYIIDKNLLAGYNNSTTPQETVFRNLFSNSNDYKKIQQEYFKELFLQVEDSFFGKTRQIANQYTTNMSNLRTLLVEKPATDWDAYCGISNHSLDLDEIIDDTMKKFVNEACNHEAPHSQGLKRDKMHPIEASISSAFLIATIRVYIYDYYLKGIFLFDKYRIGITATDPMVEFLSKCFEIEMKSFEPEYFENILDGCVSYIKTNFKKEYKDIVLASGEQYISTPSFRRNMFKKIIKEEILYISRRITTKINAATGLPESVTGKIKSTDNKFVARNELGAIFPFFLNRKNTTSLYAQESNNQINIIFNGNVFHSFSKETIDKDLIYRTLFEFCFPIRKYVSLVAIHTITASNARVQSSKTFLSTKAALKARHNTLMDAKGYKDNADIGNSSSGSTKLKIGAFDAEAAQIALMPMIIRALVTAPRQILKQVCETGDLNVFYASLPYNIAKPITLALTNQIPMLPTTMHPSGNPIPPPKPEYDEFGLFKTPEDFANSVRRIMYFLPISGFSATPIIGTVLGFCGILPTPMSLFYYGLGCWWDDAVDNANIDMKNASVAAKLLEEKNIKIDKCKIAKKQKQTVKPEINRATLLLTEYL